MSIKRAFVYMDNSSSGKVVRVGESAEEFLKEIVSTYNLKDSTGLRLFLDNGCEVVDSSLIRDDEVVRVRVGEAGVCSACRRSVGESDNSEVGETGVEVSAGGEWVRLNVGGREFVTTLGTLCAREPDSVLGRMFAGGSAAGTAGDARRLRPARRDPRGAFLIDRSPRHFDAVLDYLRLGRLLLEPNQNLDALLEEAKFYGVEGMCRALEELGAGSGVGSEAGARGGALGRREVVRALLTCATGAELRFQGVDLAGADLSRLDLRNINFKYARLAGCKLSGANLSGCQLERADLAGAVLDGAQLTGVRALCANMEGASLKGCNMEDPAGSRAVLEGVNLKGANLEGSNMAGANLRVATLKHANLQNCDLRAAVLAGADLEWCDLSGSDLQEANLRGANLKDAAFELMLTPLHMAQTIR